jgi:hypothetical protein
MYDVSGGFFHRRTMWNRFRPIPTSVEPLRFETKVEFILEIETAGMFRRLVKHGTGTTPSTSGLDGLCGDRVEAVMNPLVETQTGASPLSQV